MPINSIEDLNELFLRNSLPMFCRDVLDVPLKKLQALIYPTPPYRTFTIQKRNGSPRLIHEPRRQLKIYQEKVLAFLSERSGIPKPCVHAFTRSRSILTNAQAHCSPRTQFVLNIDIEEFFPSISFYRVRGVLQGRPFNLSYEIATVVAHLCTYKGLLPQGAPTSPLLANLVCRSMDRDMMDLAKRHRAIYTRYADDLTFSFSVRRAEWLPANICSYDSGDLILGNELKSSVERHSFRINHGKTRLSTRLGRIEVTGLTINEAPNVRRIYIDKIRGALHAWEAYGYNAAQQEWESRVASTNAQPDERRVWMRQTRTQQVPALKNVLWGKLLYLRMIRGPQDSLYLRLAERFNTLVQKERRAGTFSCATLPLDTTVRNAAQAKRAVFIVEWQAEIDGQYVGALGTAFAYKDIGLVTCEHVIKVGDSGPYADQIKGAEIYVRDAVTDKSWPVRIVHIDKDYDLAVLAFAEPNPPEHWHFEGLDRSIETHKKGVLIGFPNHTRGKSVNLANTEIINVYARAGLRRIEINTTIRKGNSGGPLVDSEYKVAGVAQQGATQERGNDECLCVTQLDAWIALNRNR